MNCWLETAQGCQSIFTCKASSDFIPDMFSFLFQTCIYLQGVTWKTWVMGISYSQGQSSWTEDYDFSKREQSAIGIIFPGI